MEQPFTELQKNPVCDICNQPLIKVNDEAFYCNKCFHSFIPCECGGVDYCGPCEVVDGEFDYAVNAHGGCDICDIGYEVA